LEHVTDTERRYGLRVGSVFAISTGLCAAQVIPALTGTLLGIPAGIFLQMLLRHGVLTVPAWWALLAGRSAPSSPSPPSPSPRPAPVSSATGPPNTSKPRPPDTALLR
jgi:hypothetical protein